MTQTTRALLTDAQFNNVRATILSNNPGMEPDLVGHILLDALAFLATAASSPGQALVPSRVVDEGWHALILHTNLYFGLCARFGNFVPTCPSAPTPAATTRPSSSGRSPTSKPPATRSTATCGAADRHPRPTRGFNVPQR